MSPSVVPPCAFEVGDIVSREGVGAAVPPRDGVAGAVADGPVRGVELSISTSEDEVVTISVRVDGVPREDEVCALA